MWFLVIALLVVPLAAEETLRLKGEYFLYSDDHSYIYGGGKIEMKGGGAQVAGDAVYMDINQLSGVIYGNVRVTQKGKKGEKSGIFTCDALFFKGVPPRFLKVKYRDTVSYDGDQTLADLYRKFEKKTPELLKNSALYFEFRECRINKRQRIEAKIVVPYMMGVPTGALKRFAVKRGKWKEKTMLAFNNVNYTGVDGLSVSAFLRMREKWLSGDFDVKAYERKFFKLEGIKRGVMISGKSSILVNKKSLLDTSALLNTGDQSFSLRLSHQKDFKFFRYTLSQKISGREKQSTFTEFSAGLTIKKLKLLTPFFSFTHDLKESMSYRISTPFNIWKKLYLDMGWNRKIIKGDYLSDTSDFTASMAFNGPLFTLNSNYNFSRNLVEATVRKNFSVNLRLKPVYFLARNISVDVSSVYMFSSLPYGDQTRSRVSPGLNIAVNSAGITVPLGLELVPTVTFNQLWDNREENFTDFNYSLALRKQVGVFSAGVSYSLASRYRADNFWIEGSNRQNMNLDLEVKHREDYAFLLRFYYDDRLDLETISLNGKMVLPFKFTFSSFLLYYNKEKKFRTVEVFIEKVFKNKIRIQGGYSLALKRFFIKFLTM